MELLLTPARLRGTVTPPPSKSQVHRLLLAAALGEGEAHVGPVALSQDIEATVRCLEALGASFRPEGDGLRVRGLFAGGRPAASELPRLDCGESGSTLRFLIPVALAVAGGGVFTGRGRLLERPQGPYEELFAEKGVAWHRRGDALIVSGRLEPGIYRLPGDVSSQFFTGLLYALPLLPGPSRLESRTAMESAAYLTMTLEALAAAGVPVTAGTVDGLAAYAIPGGGRYRLTDGAVEADWSQAAFFLTARLLGNPVEVTGLRADSSQGDRVMAAFCRQLAGPGDLALDVRECPDLVPALALGAALRDGRTTALTGAARLRLKESDRLAAIADVLGALGARVEEGPDFLRIQGVAALDGGTVSSHNDHRIAMMAAVAATRARGPVRIRGAEAVAKSYPDFW